MVQVPDTGSEVGRTLGMLSLTGTLPKVPWLDPLIIYFNILNMNSFEQTTFTFRNGAHRNVKKLCTMFSTAPLLITRSERPIRTREGHPVLKSSAYIS